MAPTLVEQAAAGKHVTVGERKGEHSLDNSNKQQAAPPPGDRTSKHNGVLSQNAIRARCSIIVGDKEKRSRAPRPCCHKAQCAAT